MIELLLLLIGARVVRRKWWILFSFGSAWTLLGLVIFADAMTDDRIPAIYFTVPLTIDAVISLIAAFNTAGTERSLSIGKAVLFVAIVLVVVEAPWHEDMIVGSRFSGSVLIGIYAGMGLIWGAGALISPLLAGLAMQTTTHGLPLFVAFACALFTAAALFFKDAPPPAQG